MNDQAGTLSELRGWFVSEKKAGCIKINKKIKKKSGGGHVNLLKLIKLKIFGKSSKV